MPKLVLDEPEIVNKPRLVLDEEPKQKLAPKLVLDEETYKPKNWIVEGLKGTAKDIIQPFKDIAESQKWYWTKELPRATKEYFTAPAGEETLARQHGMIVATGVLVGMLGKEAWDTLKYTPQGAKLVSSVENIVKGKPTLTPEELKQVGRLAEAARMSPVIKEQLIQERMVAEPEVLGKTQVVPTAGKFMPPAVIPPKTPNIFAGNIKLTKYVPEVQTGIKQVVEQAPEIVKREVISNEVLKQKAGELSDTPTVKHLTSLPEGTLESEILKTRQGVSDFIKTSLAKDLVEFKTQIDPIVEGVKGKIGELSKVTATMGRGLQQFKIPLTDKMQLVNAIDTKINQIKKDPILGKDKNILNKLTEMRRYVGGDEFNPTVFDKAYEVWLNSILANPMTHLVNTASNLLFTLYKPLEKAFAATIETPYALITGKRTAYFGEMPQMLKGLGKALVTKPSEVAAGTKLDIIKPPAIAGFKGKVLRLPTKALQIEDDLFKHVTGMMERYSQAYATAKGEGLKGLSLKERMAELIKTPPEKMVSDIYSEQLYRTFQDNLGKIGNTIMNLRENVPGMRWIIPFIRTPANILKRSLERTPLVLGKIAIKTAKRQYTQKELFEDLGLLALAGSTAGFVGYQYLRGNVTGNVPKNKGDRDLFYRQGKQPNSFKIGDTWMPFSRYEPLGLSISLITNLIQDYAKSDKDIPEEKVVDALSGLMKTLTNKSYLSGMTNFINTIQNPEQYGERFASRLAAGFVPYSGLARFFTGIVDPTLRRPVGVTESIKAQIPGLSKTVRPKLNAFGEEVKRPGMWAKEDVSPVDRELLNLGISVGFPSNRILGRKLTEDEYNKYLKESGNMIKVALSRMFQLPGYKALSKEEKVDAIEIIVREAREKARERYKRINNG